jgi:pimeloyl-ACP methyl ester carboxylesterase
MLAATCCASSALGAALPMEVLDTGQARRVPVYAYLPTSDHACFRPGACPVALLSGGYGESPLSYGFVARALNALGYLVISVQHDLPGDDKPPTGADLMRRRMPIWERGRQHLLAVRTSMSVRFPTFEWRDVTLIGHSNGGDISALAAREDPAVFSTLITLDNRRMPLPRTPQVRVLSLRGTDFAADPGVLPPTAEPDAAQVTVWTVCGARHDEMTDEGPAGVAQQIAAALAAFLGGPSGRPALPPNGVRPGSNVGACVPALPEHER